MTDKKENILLSALDLFANEGYSATSTSKIAKKAGVSEGLIFRHFENKKGLLKAIMEDAESRINKIFSPIIFEGDPKKVLHKTIEVPFNINQSEYDFWKLQFILKWNQEFYNPDKMKPLLYKLSWAFTQLNYEDPEQEASLLNQMIESISICILRDGVESQIEMKAFLIKKYDL